jgi:hypothetical protein
VDHGSEGTDPAEVAGVDGANAQRMGAARRLVPAPRGAASSWFRRGRSADLPRYYAKHSKTDRLDSQLLAGLPMLHADGPQLIMKALERRTLSRGDFTCPG